LGEQKRVMQRAAKHDPFLAIKQILFLYEIQLFTRDGINAGKLRVGNGPNRLDYHQAGIAFQSATFPAVPCFDAGRSNERKAAGSLLWRHAGKC
jgi:hypothetical protein